MSKKALIRNSGAIISSRSASCLVGQLSVLHARHFACESKSHRFLTSNIFSKYLQESNTENELEGTKGLSPHVLHSMLDETMKTNDFQTLKLLVSQASNLTDESHQQIEIILRKVIDSNHFRFTDVILEQVLSKDIKLSDSLVQNIASKAVCYYNWNSAYLITLYMLRKNHVFPDRIFFHTTAGLMHSSKVEEVLELIQLVIRNKRIDLTKHFSYNKVNMLFFDSSVGGSHYRHYFIGKFLCNVPWKQTDHDFK